MSDRVFDAIMIDGEEGSRPTTLDFLMAMPMAQRIQLIVQRKVHFFRDGAPVDRAIALKSLIVPATPVLGSGPVAQPAV